MNNHHAAPLNLILFSLLLTQGVLAQETPVDFAREILPILSDKCFVCHGPDSQNESDLRLDSREAATSDRGGYHAVDPTDPAASDLLSRIVDQEDPMPPTDAGKPLTDREKNLLQRWIMQGGQYAQHWAFVPPQKVTKFEGVADAIDSLVGQRLQREEVEFAPPANRAVLARRAAFVLTGLPLAPDELETFLSDKSDDAYESLVDRLLASPNFGEHQARYWLDAVRYGDTHGLHLDNRRGIYPYRDWVVRAFNQNLPLDDFITWQLAGDLLPDPTLDQAVATGFVRLNPSTGEGGAIPAEFQMKNNFDRVETLGTVFLGMSLTCARCHTHKYDPVEQAEYYRLLAFFNNTAEPAMDGNSYTYGPVLRVPADQSAWTRWQLTNTQAEKLVTSADAAGVELDNLLRYANERAGWKQGTWQITKPTAVTEPVVPTADSQPSLTWSNEGGFPGAISGRAARNKVPGKDQLIWLRCNVTVPTNQTLILAFSGATGSQVFLDNQTEAIGKKTTSDRVASVPFSLTAGEHQLQIAMLGQAGSAELQVRIENPWDALAKAQAWDRCTTRQQLRMLAAAGPLAELGKAAEATRLNTAMNELENNFTTSLIAKELDKPRETRVLKRGEYDLPVGDPLQPNVLKILSPFPEDAPPNRLGLAKWLTSPDHPLVSRVLVNRIWQRTFGAGLVRTPEEFGLQGQQPTHPALLDWIAVELVESGWDLKRMLRSMVTSRTFKQSSAWRDDLDDPANQWLARGTSYRLDAEVLRDLGLWASELLDPQMGGEGCKPYQPSGMWAALAHPASNTKNYQRDQGQRLYRRSLYVYWKRTSPHPMMTLFDAPDRESSCVRRSRTNTPLQSLGLLNETQRVEMGRGLAARLMKSNNDSNARIDLLFKLLAGRQAAPAEIDICINLVNQMRQRYAETPADAEQILTVGDAPRDESLDAIEHAAWTQLAMTILASDLAILLY
ncbi:MAG: PSD1 and planctomycete cytochrome C domain-containing protein [Rubripirellula sp.]|nr:PSD1 and planctomycete cytochrome C domain-containing protein [Rubripirellula sp.]